ncbi:hypothetical protein AVEN_203262-1 [Araneus ventricosus]|uniref:Uncharacterized protein n=1 Tax=Araneus ventricosus TaxID=182803 RepID=A0A4Y2BHJ4_ARAVE|nr:hypothetical protein AVEN_77272-1 [Araneus ventricosus]GBL90756.1 hypothetical protein AVEN_127597-1 [Araneus ventricosus]GBL90841.1 hypothetical protein AVEN_186588-1 [Araneus ventricosus]GBL90854.1 hypothetical protein AVEN_203262-1 [Araneus ventricosus]
MLKYLSPVRVVSRHIRGPISRQLHTYHHRGSTRLNSPLLTNRVYGLMMSSPYSYTRIRPIQLETRLVRPGNVFPVINSPMVRLSRLSIRI